MSYEILKRHRKVWQDKKILRDIYYDWYRLILENMADNRPVLEIGSGSGNFKDFFPEVISSDFINCKWTDLSLDAHKLPFKKNSLGNIIFIDVLHHLANYSGPQKRDSVLRCVSKKKEAQNGQKKT